MHMCMCPYAYVHVSSYLNSDVLCTKYLVREVVCKPFSLPGSDGGWLLVYMVFLAMHVSLCICHVHVSLCICACVFVHMCMCPYVYMCMCPYAYVHVSSSYLNSDALCTKYS